MTGVRGRVGVVEVGKLNWRCLFNGLGGFLSVEIG